MARRGYTTSSSSWQVCAAPQQQQQQPAVAAAAAAQMPAGPAKGSDVPRINIGVFGVMNAGKSTLMNAITRQETSIVDATPGTTAGASLSPPSPPALRSWLLVGHASRCVLVCRPRVFTQQHPRIDAGHTMS